jgi:hypothetical protein
MADGDPGVRRDRVAAGMDPRCGQGGADADAQ